MEHIIDTNINNKKDIEKIIENINMINMIETNIKNDIQICAKKIISLDELYDNNIQLYNMIILNLKNSKINQM